MQAIVTLILNHGNPDCLTNGLLEEKWPYLESGKRNQTGRHLDVALTMPRPRTLKTHLPWQALPETAEKVHSRVNQFIISAIFFNQYPHSSVSIKN